MGLRCSAEAAGQLKPRGDRRSPWTRRSRWLACQRPNIGSRVNREVHARLCVQRRLVCSAGDKPAGARVRSPVVWIAGWRETNVASKVSETEGRARNRRAKARWGAENRCGTFASAGWKRQHGGKDTPSNWGSPPRTCPLPKRCALIKSSMDLPRPEDRVISPPARDRSSEAYRLCRCSITPHYVNHRPIRLVMPPTPCSPPPTTTSEFLLFGAGTQISPSAPVKSNTSSNRQAAVRFVLLCTDVAVREASDPHLCGSAVSGPVATARQRSSHVPKLLHSSCGSVATLSGSGSPLLRRAKLDNSCAI